MTHFKTREDFCKEAERLYDLIPDKKYKTKLEALQFLKRLPRLKEADVESFMAEMAKTKATMSFWEVWKTYGFSEAVTLMLWPD